MPVVLGSIDAPGLFREIGHSFLREKGLDDVTGEVFYSLFSPGMDSWTAEDLKSRMPPGFEQIYMIRSDVTFREKQGKDFGSNF